ncbi:TraR/DksA C4-type zinc finger protein [Actinomadura sp. ATCC 31491]|uniref:TraR/DksA C4-type zinc finger protein n=1 Tax=Actinomadura luzonensis TaxID=2805427 RepID=A0ABT0FUV7_9ACTN|nr:TraR/DksA C4-type zinc finger protein [Actinomadura luzonensis]MCK2215943.1 TraR/DksA C4-type zinc finger protein [Actinomadura luzonensis]
MAGVGSLNDLMRHYDRHLAQLESLRELLHDELSAERPRGSRPARRRVAALEAALERMDRGCYGTCLRCGALIPYEQLAARPERTRCDGCAEHHHKAA